MKNITSAKGLEKVLSLLGSQEELHFSIESDYIIITKEYFTTGQFDKFIIEINTDDNNCLVHHDFKVRDIYEGLVECYSLA